MQSVIGKLDGSVMSMLINDLDEASKSHLLGSDEAIKSNLPDNEEESESHLPENKYGRQHE